MNVLEAAVASVVAALALAGLLFASAGAARFGTHQTPPLRTACERLAQQVLRTAQDSWKYASPGTPAPQLSGTWTTSVPVAYANAAPTSAPVTVDVSTNESATPAPNDPTRESAAIAVTVTYSGGAVTVRGAVRVEAPAPGTLVESDAAVTPPPGAP